MASRNKMSYGKYKLALNNNNIEKKKTFDRKVTTHET